MAVISHPQHSRLLLAILLAMIAGAVAMPFVRRDDWIGWISFLTIVACTMTLWGVLIFVWVQRVKEWRQSRHPQE